MRSRMSGSFSTATMSRFSCVTMAGGVRAGTTTPYQVLPSNPTTPDSATVGTSGISLLRCALETASARSRPALMCAREVAGTMKNSCTWPLSKVVSAGPAPL